MCGRAPGAVEGSQRAGQEAGQLQPLRLAAGKRGNGLTEPQVVQSDIEHRPEPRLDLGAMAKEQERLAHRQVEDFGDVLAAVGDFEDFRPIARAETFGAAERSHPAGTACRS